MKDETHSIVSSQPAGIQSELTLSGQTSFDDQLKREVRGMPDKKERNNKGEMNKNEVMKQFFPLLSGFLQLLAGCHWPFSLLRSLEKDDTQLEHLNLFITYLFSFCLKRHRRKKQERKGRGTRKNNNAKVLEVSPFIFIYICIYNAYYKYEFIYINKCISTHFQIC